jgi:ferredoxin
LNKSIQNTRINSTLEDKNIMAKKVTINKELCIGCGACTGICPNVFAIGDDGKAGVIGEADDDAAIDEAAAGCPVGAIEAK